MNNTQAEKLTGERFVGVREIANYLGVHPQSVRRMIWRGALPSVRVGNSIRVRANDVQMFLDNCPTAAKEAA